MPAALPGSLLAAAIETVAQQDPQRVAIAARGEVRTYGELAQLLPAEDGESPPQRRTRLASAEIADVEGVLRDCLSGVSTLLLDDGTTAAERERAAALFEGAQATGKASLPAIGLCTSGSSGLRRSSSTASGRRRPSFAFDTALPVLRNELCTRPAMMSGLSGPSPLYGTCSIWMPVALMSCCP